MKIRKYRDDVIFEFDTLDELRVFDQSYINDTCSAILKDIVKQLNVEEKDLIHIQAYKDANNAASGFTFDCHNQKYKYSYSKGELELIWEKL
mgnify:CR=1 FL=1